MSETRPAQRRRPNGGGAVSRRVTPGTRGAAVHRQRARAMREADSPSASQPQCSGEPQCPPEENWMRQPTGPVSIVFCHWDAHPWRRAKRLGGTTFACGLEVILRNMARWSAGCPFVVLLVVNDARDDARTRYEPLRRKFPFVREILYRPGNEGMDFGAYDAGYQWLKRQGASGDVVLMNTSVNGPHQDEWLAEYRRHFYGRADTGLCGASVNSHTTHLPQRRCFKPHLQSFFVFTNMTVLRRVFPGHLPGARIRSGKTAVISGGEIRLSTSVLDAGLGLACVSFPHFHYFSGRPYGLPGGSFRHVLHNRINLAPTPTLARPDRPAVPDRPVPTAGAPVRYLPAVKSVAIFGAGASGVGAMRLATACGWRVAAFVDNDPSRWGTSLRNVPVVGPDATTTRDVDLVIVASSGGRHSIGLQLTQAGRSLGRDFIDYLDTVQVGEDPPMFVSLRGPFSLLPTAGRR